MEEKEHNSLERSIGRIEGKIDSLFGMINTTSSDVSSLRNDFATMEKDRLSKLELSFNTLKTETDFKAKISALWTSAVVSIAIAVISAIITYLIVHH